MYYQCLLYSLGLWLWFRKAWGLSWAFPSSESKHWQVTIKIKGTNNVICGGNPQISSLIHYQDLFVILVMHIFVERASNLNQSTLVAIRMRTINKFNPQNYENLALLVFYFLWMLFCVALWTQMVEQRINSEVYDMNKRPYMIWLKEQ